MFHRTHWAPACFTAHIGLLHVSPHTLGFCMFYRTHWAMHSIILQNLKKICGRCGGGIAPPARPAPRPAERSAAKRCRYGWAGKKCLSAPLLGASVHPLGRGCFSAPPKLSRVLQCTPWAQGFSVHPQKRPGCFGAPLLMVFHCTPEKPATFLL